jgi:hypothetical protein
MGLKELAANKELETLFLPGTGVTDTGLKHLATLKNLKLLNLYYTKVTDAGVAELQKALPQCDIWRERKEERKGDSAGTARINRSRNARYPAQPSSVQNSSSQSRN